MSHNDNPASVSRRNLLRNAGLVSLVAVGSPAFLAACSADSGGTTTSSTPAAAGSTGAAMGSALGIAREF